jgi:hypothetical protein
MTNKKNWKVELCQRDKSILLDLFYSKGLDLELILYRHFNGLDESTARKRLGRLQDGKYVTKGACIRKNKIQIVFSISPKGLSAIQDLLSGQLTRKEVVSSNPEHDLELARIFDRISLASSLVEIKTENEIQSIVFGDYDSEYAPFRRLNTDIYFSFSHKGQEYKVAVEFERTKKESDRWAKYLLNYHLEDSVDLVFYICNDQTIEKRMKKIETDLAQKYSSKIFFCTLEEFYSNDEFAIFANTIGRTFTLNIERSPTRKELPVVYPKLGSEKNVSDRLDNTQSS